MLFRSKKRRAVVPAETVETAEMVETAEAVDELAAVATELADELIAQGPPAELVDGDDPAIVELIRRLDSLIEHFATSFARVDDDLAASRAFVDGQHCGDGDESALELALATAAAD